MPSLVDRLAAALAARRPVTVDDPTRRLAAVAVVLVDQPDAVLLIRRAEHADDRWSGQMALPGGRWSAGDPDLVDTALRETREEVGVDLTGAARLGALDDIAPRTPALPPIMVRPFVFRLSRRPALAPNHEVAGAHWAELAVLLDPGVFRPFQYTGPGGPIRVSGYHLEHGVVWGMTERILTPMLDLIR